METPKAPETSATTPADSPAIKIQPHRAVYTMALNSAKNKSGITDVAGSMLFEWGDACDGWPVQQHLKLHFSYAEGDESDVTSTIITWESKDNKKYNFNVRRLTNGKETENYRGHATLHEKEGLAAYTLPKDRKDMVLAPDTLFPSAHTVLILQKAREGEKLFTRRIYDGSDEEGQADISAFIGEPTPPTDTSKLDPALSGNPLMAQTSWPVRLAFFKPDTETGEPDYEMNLNLQANGIARSMLIDYGDFSVSGTLSALEALPASGC